jgi:hypothetical protein
MTGSIACPTGFLRINKILEGLRLCIALFDRVFLLLDSKNKNIPCSFEETSSSKEMCFTSRMPMNVPRM